MIRSLVELFLAHSHSRKQWDPSQASLGKERRVFLRVAYASPCKMDHPLYGLQSEGKAVNLSMGGMGLEAPVAWPEGSQVNVTFDSLVLSGLVVFRKSPSSPKEPCRYGIKFQKLSYSDLLKLRRIIHGGRV